MKLRYLALFFVLLLPACQESSAWMSPVMLGGGTPAAAPSCADSSCTGFLVCQNFEGAGYDNSESWTEVVPASCTVDEDDATATVLRGSQQLELIGSGSASGEAKSSAINESDVWFHVLYKPADATPGTAFTFTGLYEDTTARAYLVNRTDGNLRVYHGTSYLTSSSAVFADNTPVHIWMHYVAGSGADGVYSVYWSATGDRPTDPQLTDDNGTSVATSLLLRVRNYVTTSAYFDQILVDNAEIGDVCE